MNKTFKNEEAKDKESCPPLPVPGGIRTNRALPRFIAGLITVIWIVVLVIGASALAKKDSASLSPFDGLLKPGNSYWGAKGKSSASSCIAYAATSFTPPFTGLRAPEKQASETTLEVEGVVRFLIYETPGTAHFTLKARFSELLRLIGLESSVKAGSGQIRISSLNTSPPQIETNVEVGTLVKRYVTNLPNPIYLARHKEHYFFHFPKDLQKLLERQNPADQFNVSWQKLDLQDFEHCRSEVLAAQAGSTDDLINLGPYLSLFQIQQDNNILLRLTEIGASTNDQVN